jgi:hypothetical protein
MHRLIALLVVWAGLLGMAGPALACANAAVPGDCCPTGAPAGCAQQAPFERIEPSVVTCCVSAAAPTELAIDSVRKPNADHQDRPATPSTGIDAPAASASLSTQPLRYERSVPAVAANAALTYLLTGRLRL